jgi:hypothetical protein
VVECFIYLICGRVSGKGLCGVDWFSAVPCIKLFL